MEKLELVFTWKDGNLFARLRDIVFVINFAQNAPYRLQLASPCCACELPFSEQNLNVVKHMNYETIAFHKFLCPSCEEKTPYDYSFYLTNVVENALAFHGNSFEAALAFLVEKHLWACADLVQQYLEQNHSRRKVQMFVSLLNGSIYDNPVQAQTFLASS